MIKTNVRENYRNVSHLIKNFSIQFLNDAVTIKKLQNK